ncbi:enamine deaminase RidA (YjgF/YER057c/UK114 family) [Mycolicibacterium iranicum]|uniref:Enamine deaminase RidA (YjgF/YER057c/UK114 family) n=1 Tax=Mycolicibacterium iranicum TaxID=912594 RepID=A0A839Q5M3_MYCIR|nr:RidA family protein [Mycolicibacterium iranicum]MBB2990783.1 enamine deaminase RidA (YjgF/YER057c/UK114 family) [Mycolicibacterium iranicum]
MTDVEFFNTPGYGEKLRETLHYSQAVRIGDRVEISGQGGVDDDLNIPDSLEEEIVLAFDNVERTLATAGAGWGDVVHVNSYHVASEADAIGAAHNDVMVAQFRARMPERAPIWTQTGVTVLGLPGMRVEIRVTAILGK